MVLIFCCSPSSVHSVPTPSVSFWLFPLLYNWQIFGKIPGCYFNSNCFGCALLLYYHHHHIAIHRGVYGIVQSIASDRIAHPPAFPFHLVVQQRNVQNTSFRFNCYVVHNSIQYTIEYTNQPTYNQPTSSSIWDTDSHSYCTTESEN